MEPAIILVRPQMGENIGAAARAMFNFGLTDLRLVAPRDGWPSHEAERNSAGALEAMPEVKVFGTLAEAVADLHCCYATTARERDLAKEILTPEQTVERAVTSLKGGQKCGFVFGAERTGLINEEIVLCQYLVTIPANPGFNSFNLAQAVLLMGYEWFRQSHSLTAPLYSAEAEIPATQGKLEEFFSRLENELDERGFFKTPSMKPTVARNIRTMLMRAQLTDQEVRTFHGVLSALIKD